MESAPKRELDLFIAGWLRDVHHPTKDDFKLGTLNSYIAFAQRTLNDKFKRIDFWRGREKGKSESSTNYATNIKLCDRQNK